LIIYYLQCKLFQIIDRMLFDQVDEQFFGHCRNIDVYAYISFKHTHLTVTAADEDIDFPHDITSDMARVYNWDVKRRQSEKIAAS